jgi:hypothetical protein
MSLGRQSQMQGLVSRSQLCAITVAAMGNKFQSKPAASAPKMKCAPSLPNREPRERVTARFPGPQGESLDKKTKTRRCSSRWYPARSRNAAALAKRARQIRQRRDDRRAD